MMVFAVPAVMPQTLTENAPFKRAAMTAVVLSAAAIALVVCITFSQQLTRSILRLAALSVS